MEQIIADLNGVDAPPQLCFAASEVLNAAGELGGDMNGKPMLSEIRSWLDEEGITDRREREFYRKLFRAYSSERSAIKAEQREADEEERKLRGGRG